jgi:RNA polymerase sigma-B factor
VDVDVWLLHVRYQRTRSADVLAALVGEYARYARNLARRFDRGNEPLEDLEQCAIEALIGALQRFDCARGIPFLGFATPTLSGALKRHYRDSGWAVRIPGRFHELASTATEAAAELTVRNRGCHPSLDEVASHIDVDGRLLDQAQSALRARLTVSLDARPTPGGDQTPDLAVTDDGFERSEGRIVLAAALADLPARDKQILGLYFFDGLTQDEIGRRMGVSQMQASRWIRAAVGGLRARMGADEAPGWGRESIDGQGRHLAASGALQAAARPDQAGDRGERRWEHGKEAP